MKLNEFTEALTRKYEPRTLNESFNSGRPRRINEDITNTVIVGEKGTHCYIAKDIDPLDSDTLLTEPYDDASARLFDRYTWAEEVQELLDDFTIGYSLDDFNAYDVFTDRYYMGSRINEAVDARPNHSLLTDLLYDGVVDYEFIAESLMKWLSDDELGEFIDTYDLRDVFDESLNESRRMEEDERAAYQGQKAKDVMYAMLNTDAMDTYEKHKKSSDDGDLSQTYDRLAEIGSMARKHNNRRINKKINESNDSIWERAVNIAKEFILDYKESWGTPSGADYSDWCPATDEIVDAIKENMGEYNGFIGDQADFMEMAANQFGLDNIVEAALEDIYEDTYNEYEIEECYIMEDKNLENVEHSMTKILIDNKSRIESLTSPKEIFSVVKRIFEENNLDTEASRRLLNALAKSNRFDKSLQAVYNSILKGTNNGVTDHRKKW